MFFRYLCNYLPLEKGGALHLPFPQGCFVPSLVEIGPVVLEKKMKMWKVYDNDNDDGQQTDFDQKNTHIHKIKIELLFSSSLLHILGPLSMFHQSMNQLSSLLTWDIYCLYQNPQKIDSNHQIWKSYMWYTSIEVCTLVY